MKQLAPAAWSQLRNRKRGGGCNGTTRSWECGTGTRSAPSGEKMESSDHHHQGCGPRSQWWWSVGLAGWRALICPCRREQVGRRYRGYRLRRPRWADWAAQGSGLQELAPPLHARQAASLGHRCMLPALPLWVARWHCTLACALSSSTTCYILPPLAPSPPPRPCREIAAPFHAGWEIFERRFFYVFFLSLSLSGRIARSASTRGRPTGREKSTLGHLACSDALVGWIAGYYAAFRSVCFRLAF